MKKRIIFVMFLLSLLLVSCSHTDTEDGVKQLDTKDIKNIEENNVNKDDKLNSMEENNIENNESKPVIQQEIKNITVEDNELYDNLKILCESPRIYNSDGEKRASEYLMKKLSEYGYQTKIQEFPVYKKSFDDFLSPSSVWQFFYKFTGNDNRIGTGKNIIATTTIPDGKKTLYITAHYDTTADTNGIRDNGSGVVTVMEISRQLQGINLPINVEFILFSGEEAGLQGSTYFVSQLTQEEKNNSLGCINIDVVGQQGDSEGDSEVALKTYLSQINVLSLLMDKYHKFAHTRSEASDHTSFYMGEIPAIYLADKKVITKDTTVNPLDEIDIEKLKELTKIICDFILNFNLNNYDNAMKNSYTKEYTDLPDTEMIMGYTLIQANKILKESGSGSKIQYLLKNDKDNQLKITEEDNRFLDDELINQIENFDVYKEHIRYNFLEDEEENIIIQYKDEWTSYNYGVLEGKITVDEALQLIEERSGFTQSGSLFFNLD
jgi:hypothetical protein